jgi:hypothetical protein
VEWAAGLYSVFKNAINATRSAGESPRKRSRARALPAVRLNRLFGRRVPTIVEEVGLQPEPHQGLGPELGGRRLAQTHVGKLRAHVVQQQIGVCGNLFVTQCRDGRVPGSQRGKVAPCAPDIDEDFAAPPGSGRRSERPLPVKDVAAAGGWKDITTLIESYQQPDEDTLGPRSARGGDRLLRPRSASPVMS